jgi:hypothetical protein
MKKQPYTYLSSFLNNRLSANLGKESTLIVKKPLGIAPREMLRRLERSISLGELTDVFPDPEKRGFKFSDGTYQRANGKGTSRDFVIFNLEAFEKWFTEHEPSFKVGNSSKKKTAEELSTMSPEERKAYFKPEIEKLRKKHQEKD